MENDCSYRVELMGVQYNGMFQNKENEDVCFHLCIRINKGMFIAAIISHILYIQPYLV